MSPESSTRALRLRAVAMEFRTLALRGTDDAFRDRMLRTAIELESFANALGALDEGDVVWDDSPAHAQGPEL